MRERDRSRACCGPSPAPRPRGGRARCGARQTVSGSPARRPTSIPYERSAPPGSIRCRNRMRSPTSRTATLKLRTRADRPRAASARGSASQRSSCSEYRVQVLGHRPSDRDAVVGRRPPADLVEEDEAARGRRAQDRARLRHLHHERGLPPHEIVARADAREEPIDDRPPWRLLRARSCPSARAGR